MSTTIELCRGEVVSVPFEITDAASGLAGKRVTWVVGKKPNGERLLSKASNLGSSSSAVTISTQTAASITGYINVFSSDYAAFPLGQTLYASLWVDDGAGVERCVTDGGYDYLSVLSVVPKGG